MLSAVFLALFLASASFAEPTAPPPADPAGASYHFAMAKLLAVEGSLAEALSAYEEAEKLAPEAPYVRLEHAQLLTRMAEYSRNPGSRDNFLRQAAEQIALARRLAPDNLDVLRATGSIYLDLAAKDPEAMTTALDALEAVRRRDPADVESLLTLGRLYLDQRQPAKAAEVLRDLVTNVPQQRMAYALLVEALLQADKPAEAEAALQEILSFDTSSLEARLTLAELLDRRGDHASSITLLKGASEEARAEPRLRRQLAWSLYLNGDLEEALTTVDPLLTGQETSASLPLLKGLILTAEGRNSEALELLKKVREAQPKDVTIAATMARVLAREGRRDEAARVLAELAETLAADPEKADDAREARIELAQVYGEAKDWDKASQTLKPLLESKDPEVRGQAVLIQADNLIQAKKYDEALALVDAEEASPVLTGKRAEALIRAGREEEGNRLLSGLAASEDPQTAVNAVQVYHRLDRYDESIPVLEKIAAARPELPIPGFLLGAAYERVGQRDKAIAEFRRVLKLEPDFHAALNYLGYTFAEKGENLDEAVDLTRRAVALDPDNGSYVDSLGWAYYQLGRYDQARGYLERAARLEPEDATLQEHLGDVYVALGQKERAREAYRRAVELDDDNLEKVRQKLDKLGGESRR
ncbi:MAG TPA: tetratricopeptide repeat protein [Thermoanaerobaculia bacterium]|nr:tetratricopeptide repeat protein [Thermoanaerobaculia bacterium]